MAEYDEQVVLEAGENMAWVSVHDNVIGGKLRELSNELGSTQEEALGILVTLWLWGLNNADKEGRIRVAEKDEILDAFSRKLVSKMGSVDIVDALVLTKWIDIGENGEFFIHDWSHWQEQWYKAMERREKDAKRKADSRRKEQNAEGSNPDAETPGLPEAHNGQHNQGDQDPEQPERKSPGYTPAFESWYEEYPRHIGKGEAYKKYRARRNDGFSDEELLEAARAYAMQCKKQKTDVQYIKHPKTFLSDNLPFLDFLQKKPPIDAPEQTGGDPFAEWGDDSE